MTVPYYTGCRLNVSKVCLGTMQFADFPGHTAPSQETVTATVRAALEGGVTFFDCAECYGVDHAAHRAFGAALRELKVNREEIVIASKFGRHEPLWETDSPTGAQTVYSGKMVTEAIIKTLDALGVDYLDIMQVHWPGNVGILGNAEFMEEHPELRDNVKDCVDALDTAIATGDIRQIGVCNFGCSDLDEWFRQGGTCATNQLPYNILWRGVEWEILPRCRAENIAVLCYSALQQGLLSGRARCAADVPLGKRRTRFYGEASWSAEQCRHGDAALGAAAEAALFGEGGEDGKSGGVMGKLREVCGEHAVVEVSLAWLLSREGVFCVIVGASTPAQAERNARVPSAQTALLAASSRFSDFFCEKLRICK